MSYWEEERASFRKLGWGLELELGLEVEGKHSNRNWAQWDCGCSCPNIWCLALPGASSARASVKTAWPACGAEESPVSILTHPPPADRLPQQMVFK